jgi:hypothetical protein
LFCCVLFILRSFVLFFASLGFRFHAQLSSGMVVVGGLTRLTKSGLSMTDWKLQVK